MPLHYVDALRENLGEAMSAVSDMSNLHASIRSSKTQSDRILNVLTTFANVYERKVVDLWGERLKHFNCFWVHGDEGVSHPSSAIVSFRDSTESVMYTLSTGMNASSRETETYSKYHGI